MEILVKDLTQNRLALVLPALEQLVAQGWKVQLESRAESKGCLPTTLEDELQNQTLAHPKVQVVFWDFTSPLPSFSRPTVLFPLKPPQKAKQQRPDLPANCLWVPFHSQKSWGHQIGDVASLVDFVRYLTHDKPLRGKKVLITGGPTVEDIDPVRFITNRSSGKMGLALARAAFIAGAEVTLVLGPVALQVPEYLNRVSVRSAQQMAQAVFQHFAESDIYIGAAAVADFKPRTLHVNKIKKEQGKQSWSLELERTTDILAELHQRRTHQMLVGFSVETENEIEHSRKKLQKKGLDCIIINNPKHPGAAFGQETNKVTILDKFGKVHTWPLMNKLELSLKIMKFLSTLQGAK